MLTSEPPHLIFDGVSVFTDHANPDQLYYLPISPHLATTTVGGNDLPMFSLIEFGDGDGVSGGLLNFTTSLGVAAERLEDVRSKAADALGLDDEPRLSPVPMVDGRADLILFGRTTADVDHGDGDGGRPVVVDATLAPVADDGTGSRFVRHLSHPAKPSMYGDLHASFSAELSQDGAEIIRQALDGIIIPAIVLYSLSFTSLRPAYRVSCTVDWDRVQKHLKQRFGANLLVFSASITKAVDELVEDRAIIIEADTFVTADDDDATLLANKDRALARVDEMVAEAFFTPSLNPWKPEKDKWDRALDTVERLAHINPFGAEDALFSYNNIDYTRIDRKKLNANFSERSAIRRTIYPQAHMSGVVGDLTEAGMSIDDVVERVRLGHPWYESRNLDVFNRADFVRDGISSIKVELDYQGERRTALFDGGAAADNTSPQTSSRPQSWPSRVNGDEMITPVEVRYSVDFDDETTAAGVSRVEGGPTTVTGNVAEIDPVGDRLYSRTVVTAEAAVDFPWDRYSAIDVVFGHRQSDGSIADRARRRLTRPDNDNDDDNNNATDRSGPRATYTFTTLPDPDQVEPAPGPEPVTERGPDCMVRAIYRGEASGDVTVPWAPVDFDLVNLDDPFPTKRRLHIVAALPWADYTMVFVDLEMRDDAGRIVARESITLNANMTQREFVADLTDPRMQEVDYRVTAIGTGGNVIEVPRSSTRESRVLIREPFTVNRLVTLGLEPIDFERERIEEVTVRLLHQDLANGLRATGEIVFTSADDSGFFHYEFVDDDAESYEVQVESRSTSGTRRFLPAPIITVARNLIVQLP